MPLNQIVPLLQELAKANLPGLSQAADTAARLYNITPVRIRPLVRQAVEIPLTERQK
jgi:hypothetical protein